MIQARKLAVCGNKARLIRSFVSIKVDDGIVSLPTAPAIQVSDQVTCCKICRLWTWTSDGSYVTQLVKQVWRLVELNIVNEQCSSR